MSGESERPQIVPLPIENRPGLSKIDYRIGDFTTVRQRLLELLPLMLRQSPGKAMLTTRSEEDPAIALLDAWAMVTDVLTFYQERIANEGFLRTATERRSVLELARSIGYELSSGVAASSYLSFTVEEAPGSPDVVPVPAGTQVMSVPVKDELPQTFETSERFTAYREWNAIRPRPSRTQTVTSDTRQLYLAGSATQLQAGDFLLLVDQQPTPHTYLLPLTEVLPNPPAGYTLVRWKASLPAIAAPLRQPQVFAFRQRVALFGSNAPAFAQMPAEIKLAALQQAGQAIRGGVVRSKDNGDRWTSTSQGLPDADILCLVVRGTTLFAGTPNKGIFRSVDNGITWKAVNEGLTNQNVLALHIADKDTLFNEAIFAGTPNGGVFRSKDQGNNWVPINTGSVRVEAQGENNWQSINTSLPNTVVRSLITYASESNRGSGTIYSEGKSVYGENTEFTKELKEGGTITVNVLGIDQSRNIQTINSDSSLTISEVFSINSLPGGTAYSATLTLSYFLPVFPFRRTETLSLNEGNISSESNHVRGSGTAFSRFTQKQQEIENINGAFIFFRSIKIKIDAQEGIAAQELDIDRVENDSSLFTFGTFTRNYLTSGTPFVTPNNISRSLILVGTDEGVYRTQDQGSNWYAKNLTERTIYALCHVTGSVVFAGTDQGVSYSDTDGETWNAAKLSDRQVFAITAHGEHLFAGTNRGIFHASSSDVDPAWIEISGVNPISLAERAVRSLAAYTRGGKNYLVAATDDGIYVSENSDIASVTWQQVGQELAVQDMRAIAVSDTTKALFVGSNFKGFAPEEPKADAAGGAITTSPSPSQNSGLEWPEFRIQDPRQIDLETLYPQILPDSWIVLFDNRDPQNPAQDAPPRFAVRRVEDVLAVPRNGFGLSSKITRIEPSEPLNPDDFGLRSTQVFARTEALSLAPEPLTVGDRSFDIFQDPIQPDTVFLRDFVQNLQPQQTLIVRGRHCQMQLDHIGGVFRTQFGWNAFNTGLDNLSLRLLKAVGNALIAGTDKGLYWLSTALNSDTQWQRIYSLQADPVYALLKSPDFEEAKIWVGTEQGLYRSAELGPDQPWQRVRALPEDTVFSLVAVPVLASDPATVTATVSGTSLVLTTPGPMVAIAEPSAARGLQVGDIISVEVTGSPRQSRFITALPHDDVQAYKFNAAFEPEPSNGESFSTGGTALFVGLRRGLYRSPDQGQTWEVIPDFSEITTYALAVWQTAIVAGTAAGLWLSGNTGQAWKAIPTLKPASVRSLLVETDHLWVGTTQGLYRVSNLNLESLRSDSTDVSVEVAWMRGLRDRTILSLDSDTDRSLMAGTDRGLYRSIDGGQTWSALDAGLVADEGRSLQFVNNALWVGTEQGVFWADTLERQEPTLWESRDTGMLNSQVTALAMDSTGTVVMAGTTAGIFRSGDGGRTWEPFHTGLTPPGKSLPLRVQAVLAQPNAGGPDRWFVGTPAGIFWRDTDQPQWQEVKEGLVYRDVRAIAYHHQQIYIGTAQGGVLQLLNTSTDNLPQRWQPTGLGNTTVETLAQIEIPSNPDPTKQLTLLLAGTEKDGLFMSRDGGTLWQQITETRPGRGSLSSSGNQAVLQGTGLSTLLRPGDQINAAGQTRTVVNLATTVTGQLEITVNAPFRPDLPENTRFTINTGLTNRHITAIALGILPQSRSSAPLSNSDEASAEARTETSSVILWVATAGSGVFRTTDLGDRWEQAIANLTDLETRCIAAEPLGETHRLWLGTAHRGLFRSDDGGTLWATVNTHLTNTDVRAVLIPPGDRHERAAVLAGGIGILTSPDGFYTKPVQRGDVVQVLHPPIYLDSSDTQDTANGAIASTQPPAPLWQIAVRDKEGFPGIVQTPSLKTYTLLPAAADDEVLSEVVQIQTPPEDQQFPRLTLQQPLKYSYDPATFEILANVVRATHGETVQEVLGSGDGHEANAHFVLGKPPLTYVSADNAQGASSTLALRVNGVLWQEVPSLYPLKPQDQSYIIRIEDNGTSTVTFGDGKRGARLPSGEENVIATYRSGIGLDGNVGADSLSILKTRPQGIAEVTNPLPATGGAAPETLATARTKAPPTVRTLDRIVSLQDFEDFAQGFAGIGKAEAIALWNGAAPMVHITIAGIQGADVSETSNLYQKLVAAIDQARDPIQQVAVSSYERLLFNLEARLLLDPRYEVEPVMAQVQTALISTFTFEQRDFEQPVTSAEVIESMQQVPGVMAVDLDALYRFGRSKALEPKLQAASAHYDPQTRSLQAAQLLLLNAAGIQLTSVSTL